MLRIAWAPGPAREPHGPVVVSVTRYRSHRWLDLPGVYWNGLMLRRRWPRLTGAVGTWLWTEPAGRLSGSVSVWESRRALGAFVGLPEHVRIMERYRDRGDLDATTWTQESTSPREVWLRARDWLREAAGEPHTA